MRIEPQLSRRSRTGGRRNRGAQPPNAPTVDQVLFVLMRNRRQWFTIVDSPTDGNWGSLGVSLHRRGCEVTKVLGTMRVRWTHDVPSAESLVTVVRPLIARSEVA